MSSDVAIKVDGVSKSFKLPHDKSDSIKSKLVSRKDRQRGYEVQEVLKDISFEVKKGEFFGIVGRNGSGKSTLLKIISQIYSPDKGSVTVDGKLTPFIELGVGFNPELSGRENVFLNGALLGFSRKEMEKMYKDIVEFAELERFMDQKLKNYSSGMQVRLAFSVAIRADTDILVLDEVLAVGDEAFQMKCYSYFAQLKKNKKTVILVTHSMEHVQQFCDRAILIEKGKAVKNGNPSTVARQYSELFITDNGSNNKQKPIAQNNSFDIKTDFRKTKEKLHLSISLTPKKEFIDPVLGVFINHANGEIIWRWASDDNTPSNKKLNFRLEKNKKTNLVIDLNNILPKSSFAVTVLVRKSDKSEYYARFSDVIKFDNQTTSIYDKFWKMGEIIGVTYDD